MSDLPSTETLVLERDDGWLTIWLNRPDARNALSAEMSSELAAVVAALSGDRSIRGITFRGKGEVFCAGGDLKAFRALMREDVSKAEVVAFSRSAGELFHAVNTLPQVTVMLVHGAAMAGGLGLACAGDMIVATEDAKFALTETMLGIPPAQIAPFVVQRTGIAAARRIMLTAARFDGREAARLGIVDKTVPDVAAFAAVEAKIRDSVRRCAPGANAITKNIVHAAGRMGPEAMLDLAADGFAECLLGEEGREGVAAFLEKRKPRWT
ncbi:enoyl-CoA hydratase/isomerase family protein [Nitratireductor mangrovi]|uniref:Enoyl-CoA hydratase/isomerase family protein n=1 Tax=Nitratireductor mangrovi TaxID=2599600 RepID=A0A5B8L0T0_9HYPH|nr:enoyl-CoA hydratase-related protein [Nitratireductor mangrovi]QDZ01607.1 enoyl-CoA hydratase/isomerase family protein [Nitratireductor mangrovi]